MSNIDFNEQLGGKFNVFGMGLTLLLGIVINVLLGMFLFFVESLLPFTIPLLSHIFFGALVGSIVMGLASKFGRCRNRFILTASAILVGLVSGLAEHLLEYLIFFWQAFRQITTDATLSMSEANWFINQWLMEQTNHKGLWGFILLKLQVDEFKIETLHYGAPVGSTISG